MALADRLAVDLISVDSAQVYRGLDIGSAKVDAATRRKYPHALIDVCEPEQSYSAADFVRDCRACLEQSAGRGRIPVLVGGTMMWFQALIYGLDELPSADAELRREIAEQAARRGWASLHAELARVDPSSASRISPSDTQRIQRALEVIRLTGKGPSHFHRHNRLPRLATLRLVLTPADRHLLHKRIGQRLSLMLEQGFVDEVALLRRRPGLTVDSPAMRSVGYRQAWHYLEERHDRKVFVDKATAATRQLAKRQLTALRQFSGALWYDPDRSLTIKRIFKQVERFSRQWGGPG
jgi:tRNA dimethylallyltransferase